MKLLRRFSPFIFIAICVSAFVVVWQVLHLHTQSVHGQTMTFNGVANQTVANVNGFAQVTSLAGTPYSSYHCAEGPVTSNTSGVFTTTLSGFTTIDYVNASAVASSSTAAGSMQANVTSFSATAITGNVLVPSVSVLGLITLALAGTSTTVWIEACGV